MGKSNFGLVMLSYSRPTLTLEKELIFCINYNFSTSLVREISVQFSLGRHQGERSPGGLAR